MRGRALARDRAELGAFLAVGVAATALQYLVYAAGLAWLDAPAAMSSAGGYLAGSLLSYALNYHLTFRSQRRHGQALPRFYAMVFAAFILNTALVGLSVDVGGLHPWAGQVGATIACLAFNYAVSRRWVFGGRP